MHGKVISRAIELPRVIPRILFFEFLLVFQPGSPLFSPWKIIHRRRGCSIRIRIPSRGICPPLFFSSTAPRVLHALSLTFIETFANSAALNIHCLLDETGERGEGVGTSVNNYTRKRPARRIAAFPGFASNLRGLI